MVKHLSGSLLCLLLISPLAACQPNKTATATVTPTAQEKPVHLRDHIPPLFFPHRTDFTCVYRDVHLPPISAEADELLQQALLLEWNERSPAADKNWKEIIALTQQAAKLGNWKARLNLVHLRLEGRGTAFDLPKDEEVAVQEVEAMMLDGIPDAFDLMGNFYERGTGVSPDISKAYAFYQYAAELGSPSALTFLGDKMDATYDDPQGTFWGNEKIGRQMLECAFAQGYGPAAEALGRSYAIEIEKQPNLEAKEAMQRKAMRYYHEGVKMGSAASAGALGKMFEDGEGVASVKDPSRGERYWSINDSLNYYGPILGLKLPNLDKVLPLPPAKLPHWDSDRDSLINAAKARQMKLVPPPGPAVKGPNGRSELPGNYKLEAPGMDGPRKLSQAPRKGYWQAWYDHSATQPGSERAERSRPLDIPPLWLEAGEAMPVIYNAQSKELGHTYWQNLHAVEIPQPLPARQAAGYEINVTPPVEPLCRGDQPCPKSGIWQARLRPQHPLASLVNQQAIRQAWVNQGESFPDPEHDWHLDEAADLTSIDIAWRLLEVGDAMDRIEKA
ncbi:sel1 repeat family protein [Neisseriaceae bacterium TC5R-5]|nr:sel1 repeat family protein [Neisseriaceae bacterium TC5R-5]